MDNYILFMGNRDDVDSILACIRRSVTWNAHAKFLIVVDPVDGDWNALVTYIFERFWVHFVLNIVVHVTVDESHVKVWNLNYLFV